MNRKLVATTAAAVIAILIAVLGLAWFHVRFALADGTAVSLHVGLHSVSGCVAGRCGREAIGSEGAFPLFATFTFWVSVLFAIVVAVQTALRATGRSGMTLLSLIGGMLVVLGFAGMIVCTLILGPASAASEFGSVTVHYTLAAPLLLVGYIAGGYALYFATPHEELSAVALAPLVKRAAIAPVVARQDKVIELDVEPERERDPFLPPDQ